MSIIVPSVIWLKIWKRTLPQSGVFLSQPAHSIYSKTKEWPQDSTLEILQEVERHWNNVVTKPQKSTNSRKHVDELGKKYVLAMFPYPSGELHMGHVRVYTISDSLARYYRALGYQVIHPIGWDAFGLPAENAAIERNVSPSQWTDHNIEHMRQQLCQLGCHFDWDREVRTCDPQYYRWTQEIFLRLFKAGLAYRKQAFVNWDPVDQTVLADEQVDDKGRAWRSGAKVERRLLNQWYIQCTRLSALLQDGLDSPQLQDWRNIVTQQRQWIGRCDGFVAMMNVNCNSQATGGARETLDGSSVPVYTRLPELLCGISFLGVRSDHELALAEGSPLTVQYTKTLTTCDASTSSDIKCSFRVSRVTVTNPLSGATIPIIVSDELPFHPGRCEFYVGYGAGSELDAGICKAGDFQVVDVLQGHTFKYIQEQTNASVLSDLEGVNKHNRLIDHVIRSTIGDGLNPDVTENASHNFKAEQISEMSEINHPLLPRSENSHTQVELSFDPNLHNSSELTGLSCSAARVKVLQLLEQRGAGGFPASAHLKDWLISRQRSWGAPIPVVHCPSCGSVPVPSCELPVLLPCHRPDMPQPHASLRSIPAFTACNCPQCGGAAERETDTMDTFVDSSWYFLRYLDPGNAEAPFQRALVDAAMPVDVYVGGEEHAVLHLYYARFMQLFLHSQGLTSHSEPFTRLLLVGRIKAPAYVRVSDGKYLRPDDVDCSVSPPVERGTGAPVKVMVEKMSKSKHNGVAPSAVMAEFSCDATRLAVLREEAPANNRTWRQQESFFPVMRWIFVLWKTVGKFVHMRQTKEAQQSAGVEAAEEVLRGHRNRAVQEVTRHYADHQQHTAVRKLETFTRHIRSAPLTAMYGAEYERSLAALLLMLAPIMPHLVAEMWLAFSHHAHLPHYKSEDVHEQPWPEVDHDYQPCYRVYVTVNDDHVYKGDMSIASLEALQWQEDRLLQELTQEHQALQVAMAGQPVLRSTFTLSDEECSVKLVVYTLDDEQLVAKKKRDKQAKKLLKAQRLKENSAKTKPKS
ncbi:probable leucine--tRNA ligase, mitochondrial isoform X2 [Hyalella azteca]|uniref:leucine--tRNA ligase n=2 Tax=Hyalella azteca TaxID=294128 RepID=A0A8B7NME5_HYAAZ|nr:probable leucine--tRNA ligase, mitochondrial isoform X1 [Hyalella azteca]XP_018014850.1 probable leucine--tRNA ligase, mitochondrial isoform X2 [Hyalella azteca]